METMIKGIVFDLDGTLLNTLSDLTKSVNYVLEDYGRECLSEDDVRKRVGRGFKNLMSQSLNSEDDLLLEEAVGKFEYYYDQFYMDETFAYAGIKELLKELSKKGIKFCVNTNKKTAYAKRLIEYIFDDIDFVEVIGQRDGVGIKPDPTSCLELIELMGLNKDEVIYLGDGGTDYHTSINAGIDFVGCSWGYRGREALEELGVSKIIDEPKELLKYI